MYDSRAAVYDSLENPRDALRDAKKVISLAPSRWQGYARSAKVLLKAQKHDAAVTMVGFALDRVESADSKRFLDLTRLQEKILQLRDLKVNHGRNYVSHLSQLPVEIFGVIFREVTSHDFTRVLVLAGTCTQWRAIALNTAALWGTLVLSEIRPIQKARIWTERSKGRIRQLFVRRGVTSDPDWSFNHLNGLSWDVLRVCWLEVHSFFPLSTPLSPMLSALEELQIYHPSKRCCWNQFLTQLTNSKLHSLTISDVIFNWATLTPQFTELVSLSVHQSNSDRGDDILDVLEANPKLQKLMLDFVQSIAPASARQTQINLLQLIHLEIGGTISMSDIFHNVIFPSLAKLTLSRNSYVDAAFTQLTPNTLTELRVQACGFSISLLIQFLCSASSLQTLALTHLSCVNAVVEALVRDTDPANWISDRTIAGPSREISHICPSLVHVEFSHSDVTAGPLVRLIKSRLASTMAYTHASETEPLMTPSVAQILSLVVDGCPQVEASALPWLRSKVDVFSCVYMSKKEAKWKR